VQVAEGSETSVSVILVDADARKEKLITSLQPT